MTANGPVPCILSAWQASQDELRGFLRRRLRGHDAPSVADDLLHEVFLRLVRQGGNFCAVDNARAWLFQVARNLLIDHQRSQRPTSELPDDLAYEPDNPAPVDELADCLPAALASLAPDDQDVLTQCDLGGMTQAEYAALRGLSLPGAKSRVQRARTRLREAMIERCGVRFDADSGQICCHAPPAMDDRSRSD
ncbi:MAG TPA: sigma-70 family RNA polymerase sigma factor [Gammaproteobacteria bacterium]|nr:sigma-70 family RNA polymerase sigma factor [Gammaproteobacteria bacterium]